MQINPSPLPRRRLVFLAESLQINPSPLPQRRLFLAESLQINPPFPFHEIVTALEIGIHLADPATVRRPYVEHGTLGGTTITGARAVHN